MSGFLTPARKVRVKDLSTVLICFLSHFFLEGRMDKIFGSLITIIVCLFLGGCVSVPPGAARGYQAPRNAEEQLWQVDQQLRADCSREAQITNTVIGAGVGAAAGALLSSGGGRHGRGDSRVPGAVVGGLAGGAIASSTTGMNCQQLWQYRQQIQQHINAYRAARQPVSRCDEVVRNGVRDIVCRSTTGTQPGWQNYPR